MKENSMADLLVFILIGGFAIISMPFVLGAASTFSLETAPQIQDTRNISFNGVWTDEGTLNGLEVDSQGNLYAPNGQSGNWTSKVYDVPRNRILSVDYLASISGGSGNATVRVWNGDGLDESSDETVSFDFQQGANTKELNLSQYDYFQFEIYLDDDGPGGNTEIESFEVNFDILSTYLSGIGTAELAIILLLVMMFGVVFLLFSIIGIKDY